MTTLELQTLIDEIEKQKDIIRRVEYEPLRADYIMGKHRKHSMTKRECESKLSHLKGELNGMERALSVLYTEVASKQIDDSMPEEE